MPNLITPPLDGSLTFGLGSDGSISYDPLEGLQAYWQARADLQAATSDGKLWQIEAPEGTVFPYLEYFLVSEDDADVPTAAAGWKTVRTDVQLSAHAATAQAAADLRRQIESALFQAPLVVQGSLVLHCLPHGPTAGKGDGKGPGGMDSWMNTVNVEILWIQPVPVLSRT